MFNLNMHIMKNIMFDLSATIYSKDIEKMNGT